MKGFLHMGHTLIRMSLTTCMRVKILSTLWDAVGYTPIVGGLTFRSQNQVISYDAILNHVHLLLHHLQKHVYMVDMNL